MQTACAAAVASILVLSAAASLTNAQPRASLTLRGGEMAPAPCRVVACGGSVSDGKGFSAAVVDDGKILMWGDGSTRALGAPDSSTEGSTVPAAVAGLESGVSHVALGGKHAAAISQKGELFTWGTGFCGQLGHGSGEDKAHPTLVEGPLAGLTVTDVSCGETHSVCSTSDGRVFTWGMDIEGQLGHGASGHKPLPTPLGGVLADVQVSAVDCAVGPGGPGHTAALAGGKLYTWGFGQNGQLGHGDNSSRLEPTLVQGALADKTVVAVSCGATHTAALTDDGKVWTWGGGESGQLGHGEKNYLSEPKELKGVLEHKKMIAVACGGYHTAALMLDGSVWCWGEGVSGQLGVGGNEATAHPSMVPNLKAVALACGSHHSAAVTADGRIVTWGYNRDGQLGHGDTQNKDLPNDVLGLKAAV